MDDLSILLAHYGVTGGADPEDGDLDYDGDVDLQRFQKPSGATGGLSARVLRHWQQAASGTRRRILETALADLSALLAVYGTDCL